MPDDLEILVRKTIRKYGMLAGGEHVLVAVSGGADSAALLLCLHSLLSEFRLTLTVAHLNHKIRGAEADADEDFVRTMSAGLGLPFISETIDIKQQAQIQKQNIEELARHVRYDFLRRAAKQAGAQKIAVGHNLNDQAETALFRFIRGSGIEGLSAIHPVVDGLVIRPLLECSRDSILSYLKHTKASYRDDSSNRDFRHTRNRIRQELLPYLEKHFNPQLIATLAREAHMARETWSFIESQASELFKEIHSRTENSISINLEKLRKAHSALQKQVLRQALKECTGTLRGIASAHIDSLLSLCQADRSGARIELPHGCIGMRQFDEIVLLNQPLPPSRFFQYELGIPGRCLVAEIGSVFVSGSGAAPDLQTMKTKCSTHAFLEPSSLPSSLTIRSRIPGDRYGGQGHRKVKKMLIENKIPLTQRSFLPMIVAGAGVIWIPGFRPARSYEARPGSPECIVITMDRSQEPEAGGKSTYGALLTCLDIKPVSQK
jgi:tRNA(Ile)-lysidine synthase